ncbi:MAG: peptide chain release factor 1 [Candidatus Korarchaeota archaeon]|nr:peptide chain release factor 1 [Candidatus Korarchaeota archaeon]NIU84858.1 peptide chain release factor 1 [Candidatus Thorarchaeota archaeon]NIW14895.1 peptide chain release factor 1 [Candidatus Thorarchaeota archaeon]NIW52532.1 peptide chain release factor 1 [Candidatus Korarchaeota archaeon]
MSTANLELHELKKKIKALKGKRAVDGHSTTLVTLIIPSGTSVHEMRDLVSQELATAENIQSKQTRKHVQSALQSILRRLKKYRRFPENGLIIYCGITQEGSLELHEVVPPRQIQRKRYLCDSHFHTELLEELVKRKRQYGVILIERDNATFGMLEGSQARILKDLTGYVPSKHGKGGQSQQRFERLIEERYERFLKRVARIAKEIFTRKEIEGIILGGPAYAKEDLEDYLPKILKNKIIGKVKTQYLGMAGLREALNKGSKFIRDSRYAKEKEVMDRVMDLAGKASERLTFGFDEAFEALRNGRVETLVLSEELSGRVFKGKCGKSTRPHFVFDRERRSETEIKDLIKRKCHQYDDSVKVEQVSDDPIGFLLEKAKNYGTEVKLISRDGEPGEMLSRFDGIVGTLRY